MASLITDCSVFFFFFSFFVGAVVARGDGGEAGNLFWGPHTHTLFVVVVDVVVGMMLALFSFFRRCPSPLPRFLSHPTAEKKKGEPPALCAFDQSPRRLLEGENKRKKRGGDNVLLFGREVGTFV